MWFAILLLSACSLVYLFTSKKERSKRNEGCDDAKADSRLKMTRVGLWDSLVVVMAELVKNRALPNYIMALNLHRHFGPLFAIKTGVGDLINCIDLDLTKKIMGSPLWPDRFPAHHYWYSTSFNKPLGLFFGARNYWKAANALTLKLLHQLEFYKSERMENFVAFEMEEVEIDLAKRIREGGGKLIFCPHQLFQPCTLNIVWQVLVGRRFSRDDPTLAQILHVISKANENFSMGNSMLDIFPFFKHFPRFTFLGHVRRMFDLLDKVFGEIIAEKRKERLNVGISTDFVDGFLSHMEKNKDDECLTEENLLVVLRDMTLAGVDTTNSVLEFAIFYLSLHPEIQSRVQAEIDEVIGTTRRPAYSDRSRMLYTQAVLLEIMRAGTAVPISARCNQEDTTVDSINFTKGSIFTVNIYALHYSKEAWEDPEEFRPERFLSKDNRELINADKIMPFGLGRRSCPGKTVAHTTLFIFFVTLFQRFSFAVSPNHPRPAPADTVGLSRSPAPFYVEIRQRC